jgi:predicted AlkP superfamily phosphohydrolase/phosphomutase
MLLALGIDGASWEVLAPWLDGGALPNLAALRARARWGRVRSTTPAATFPAWTSFATASEPGVHGIFDFSLREGYAMRFVSSRDRQVPSIWQRLADAGRRVCVYNLPASYPPDPLHDGIFISGFDTPIATAIDPSFVHPRALHGELTRRFGPLVISDLNEVSIGRGWHARAREVLCRDIRRRADIAVDLLGRGPWDVFFALFGESDTAGHHFWLFHDPTSPRHQPGALEGALLDVYREIDRALGRILAAAPDDATILLLSDHGMGGAGTRVVSLNRRLAEAGLLRLVPRASDGLVRGARAAALRLLPRRLQGRLLRGLGAQYATRLEAASRFAGIEWHATRAFSEELNYFPSVWINVAGREPLGTVARAEYEAVCREVIEVLEGWRDPGTGAHIVARARGRREVYGDAPCLERAPDVVVDFALEDGYSTTLVRGDGRPGPAVWRLRRDEFVGSKGRGMNGTHREHGLYAWIGRDIASGEGQDTDLPGLGRDVLRVAGVASDLPACPDPSAARSSASDLAPPRYSPEEEAVLEARLRSLGYLE